MTVSHEAFNQALKGAVAIVNRLLESKSFGRSTIESPGRAQLATANYLLGGHEANARVSAAAIVSYDKLKEGLPGLLNGHLADFDAGKISAGQLATRLKQELSASYETALELGMRASGWLGGIDPADKRWLASFRREEWGFLNKFVEDINSGSLLKDWTSRMDMYAKTVDSVFWAGRVEGMPTETIIHWKLGVAEHCIDCLDFAANSPYTRESLPTTPRAGDSRCLSRCLCFLEFDVPGGIAAAKAAALPDESAPSVLPFLLPEVPVPEVPEGLRLPTPEEKAQIDSLALQAIFYAESAAKAESAAAAAELTAKHEAAAKEMVALIKKNNIHLVDNWPLEAAIKNRPVDEKTRASIAVKSIGVGLLLLLASKKKKEYQDARASLDSCVIDKTL